MTGGEGDPEPAEIPGSVVLVGCGRMGQALLAGWRRRGLRRLYVLDPAAGDIEGAEPIEAWAALQAAPRPLTVVLAVKPQAAADVLAGLAGRLTRDDLLISVMAGVPAARLATSAPEAAIVRAMPNIAAGVGASATAAIAATPLDDRRRRVCADLLEAVGVLVWLPEETLLDVATAVCGSGPAYFFLLAEHLAEAGVALGLPRPAAKVLAEATLAGAGGLIQARADAAALRAEVTSPGGTTAAALAVLQEKDGLYGLTFAAVAAAVDRAKDLGRTAAGPGR